MTFANFESLFKSKYQDGHVHMHGKFAGTEKNKKVTVVFSENGRCYDYYGAYEDILCRVGILVISKQRLRDVESRLEQCKRWHGTQKLFEDGFEDYSSDIERLAKEIEDYKENYIVV